jgi:hypothetical protein
MEGEGVNNIGHVTSLVNPVNRAREAFAQKNCNFLRQARTSYEVGCCFAGGALGVGGGW